MEKNEQKEFNTALNDFLLWLLSLATTITIVLFALSLFFITIPRDPTILKIDIKTVLHIIDLTFVCFILSILSRIFFSFITFLKNQISKTVAWASFLLGIMSVMATYSLLIYALSLFRHEIYGVKNQTVFIEETMNFIKAR